MHEILGVMVLCGILKAILFIITLSNSEMISMFFLLLSYSCRVQFLICMSLYLSYVIYSCELLITLQLYLWFLTYSDKFFLSFDCKFHKLHKLSKQRILVKISTNCLPNIQIQYLWFCLQHSPLQNNESHGYFCATTYIDAVTK